MARSTIHEEIDHLRTLRDELRVQANLAAKDIRDQFEEVERRWSDFEAHWKRVEREARGAVEEIGSAGRALLDEIREGYGRIREQL